MAPSKNPTFENDVDISHWRRPSCATTLPNTSDMQEALGQLGRTLIGDFNTSITQVIKGSTRF